MLLDAALAGLDVSAEHQQNAQDLELELAWVAQVVDARFKLYFNHEPEVADVFEIEPPDLSASPSAYARFLVHHSPTFAERFTLILSLVPNLRPQLLDIFFTKNKTFDRKFTEFGGVRSGPDGDFVPTGETLLFILAGRDLAIRLALQPLFDGDHFFAKDNILRLTPASDEAFMKAPLQLSDEVLSTFLTGALHRPDFGPNFPARLIETQLTWDDLVLHPGTLSQVEEIDIWLRHGETLLTKWEMAAKLRPGYRSLFYGPPRYRQDHDRLSVGQVDRSRRL